MNLDPQHADPLRPWAELLPHTPVKSRMTLHRWRERGLIDVTEINGRNYVRIRQSLRRLGIEPTAA